MFRCLRRPPKAKGLLGPPKCLPSLAGAGRSRGVKLSKIVSASSADSRQIPKHQSLYGPFTPLGKKHLARLARHGIGLHSELQGASGLDYRGIFVKLAPRHVVGFSDLRYFSELGHAFVESIVRRCLVDHEVKPLWFSVSPRGSAENKPIVRGRAKYRLNAALKQALRNAGYDGQGRRLSEKARQEQRALVGGPVEPRAAQLFGTVEIIARDPKQVHLATFEELRKYCARIVHTLETRIGIGEDGAQVVLRDGPRGRDQPWRGRPFAGNGHGNGHGNGNYQGGSNRTMPGHSGQDRRPHRHSQPGGFQRT